MPKYDYKCSSCGRIFEVTQRFHDDPLSNCIYCGGQVRKLISNSSFLLKGKGWYVTDYPSKSRKEGIEMERASGGGKKDEKNCDRSKKECESCPGAAVN